MRKTILQLAVFALALSLLVLLSTMLAFYVSDVLMQHYRIFEARTWEYVLYTIVPVLLGVIHFAFVFHAVKRQKRWCLVFFLDAIAFTVLSMPLGILIFYYTAWPMYFVYSFYTLFMIGLIGIAMAFVFKIFVPKTGV